MLYMTNCRLTSMDYFLFYLRGIIKLLLFYLYRVSVKYTTKLCKMVYWVKISKKVPMGIMPPAPFAAPPPAASIESSSTAPTANGAGGTKIAFSCLCDNGFC
jgi:hypothetical protein